MLIAKVPRYMRDGNLMLRPMRIWDGPFLAGRLMRNDILRSCGIQSRPEISWFTLYRYLRRLFFVSYCIEYSSEIVGFSGLYNLRADKSAEMSLMIFNDSRRRTGLGTKALRLLSRGFASSPFVERILVSVRTENSAALAFWAKLGFKEIRRSEDTSELELSLTMFRPATTHSAPDNQVSVGDCVRQTGT